MIVGTRVAGKPFHVDPEKSGAVPGAHAFERLHPGVVNLLDVAAVDFLPVVRLENIERARIDLPRRTADAVFVVLDDKQHGKLPLLRETDGFEKIALARRRIANGGHDDIHLVVELNAPRDAAGGQKLRSCGRWHAPNLPGRITIMRRHLAPVALSFALRKIIERQLAGRDAPAQDNAAVAVVRDNVIAFLHRHAERRQPFMSHSGNVEMSFALAIQILLAQIAMPAFEQDREQAQFIFFAQNGHVGRRVGDG